MTKAMADTSTMALAQVPIPATARNTRHVQWLTAAKGALHEPPTGQTAHPFSKSTLVCSPAAVSASRAVMTSFRHGLVSFQGDGWSWSCQNRWPARR